MSNESSANGRSVAVPSTDGTRDPALTVDPLGVLQLPEREVEPVGAAALPADPPRALAGAGADLEDVAAGHLAEDAGLGLGEPFGPPHEAGVAEELAVRRLVLVGVAVPVRPVGPPGLGFVDRTALDAGPAGAPADCSGFTCGAYFAPWHDLGMDLASLTPLVGGWSGETFLADVAGKRSVVRIYARPGQRGDAAHEVDAALLRLVRGLVPVPEVLELRRADAATGLPALLVTSYVPGTRGDELLPTLEAADRARVGARLGDLLADLAGMPMLRPGPFVDGDLAIGSFRSSDASAATEVDGLPAFVDVHRDRLAGFGDEDLAGLRAVADVAQALLDTVTRTCLVHSDFNPKNLLLDPETLEVAGVLDWEFAHAGHPYSDLGNLLRFDRDPAYADAVVAAYVTARGRSGLGAEAGPGSGPVGAGRPRGPGGGEPGGRQGAREAAGHRPDPRPVRPVDAAAWIRPANPAQARRRGAGLATRLWPRRRRGVGLGS